jgi:site-specific recombinase XerD
MTSELAGEAALVGEFAAERTKLSQLTAAWLSKYARATQCAYHRDLADWLAWCQQCKISPLEANMTHVDSWIASQRLPDHGAKPASESTIARRVSAISSWYDYLHRSTREDRSPLVTANPARTDARPNVDHGRSATVGLSVAEAARLIVAADADGPRSSALIRFLLLTGLRCGSVMCARIEDLRGIGNEQVLDVQAGPGKVVSVPLPPPIAEPVAAMLAARGNPMAGPLFATRVGRPIDEPYIFRVVRRLASTASIESAGRLSPSSLRLTFAVNALEAGVSLRDLQDAMGHATPQSTRRYDRARAAVARHPIHLIADKLASS